MQNERRGRGSYDRSYNTSAIFLCLLREDLKGESPPFEKTSSDQSFTGQVRISTERERERKEGGERKRVEEEMQFGGKDSAGAAHNFARKFDIQNRK